LPLYKKTWIKINTHIYFTQGEGLFIFAPFFFLLKPRNSIFPWESACLKSLGHFKNK